MRRFVEKCQHRRKLIFGCRWWPDLRPVRPNLKNGLNSFAKVFDALSNAAYCGSQRDPQAELEVGVQTPPAGSI